MKLFRMTNKQGIPFVVWLFTLLIPTFTIAQVDLTKLNEYVAAKDCEKSIKFVEKNVDQVLTTDPQYPEFYKAAISIFKDCGDLEQEIVFRTKLYNFYKVINPRGAAVQAFYLGNRYYLRQNDSSIHYSSIAADIFKQEYGETDIRHTMALNTLGSAYKANGEYTRARRTYLDARKIKERIEAFDSQYAKILNGLGDLYTRTYKYDDAEDCLEVSLKLKKELKGENSDYARTLFSQTILWQSLGDKENLLNALKGIQKVSRIFKEENRTYLFIKSKILEGQIYNSLDSTQQAIKILEGIIEKYPPESEQNQISKEDLSIIFHSLSLAWVKGKDPVKAIDYSEKALDQMAQANGIYHPKYALELRDHADLLYEINRSDTLDNLYLRSSEIIEKTYRKNNYEYYRSQHAYFIYLVRSGQQGKALRIYEKLGEDLEEHIVSVSQYMSIAELAEVTGIYQEYFQALLTLNLLQPENAELRVRSANAALFYKGYILENIIEDRQVIKRSSELTELAEQIQEKKIRLDELYKADQLDQDLIDEVRSEFEDLNRSFSRVKGDQIKPYESVEAEDVVYSLLSSEVALEFVRIKLDKDEDPRYVALLFHPDEDEPILIDLFSESKITDLFKGGEVNSTALYDKLYQSGSTRGLAPAEEENKVSLFTMIWEKLLPHLEDIDRIYYSADGVVHAMALHAVELAPKEYAGQKYALVQTTSLRKMANDELPKMYSGTPTAFLIGGVDYGAQDVAMVRGGGQAWGDLRYTQIEVTNIETVMRGKEFEVMAMQGPEPTHDNVLNALKKTPSPRIIHLATHGYFKSDNFLKVGEELDVSASQLDLSRSGLVLAGANDLPDGQYILSSNEIAELDLENTEVVVLSACETGLGQIYAQEGVSGLQRAFKIAGTKYMIMSLWPVLDEETQYFMDLFYKYVLEEGKTVEEAYYTTQRDMMALPFSKPKQWAGFVLIR